MIPDLSALPMRTGLWAGIGYLYARLFRAPVQLCVTAFAISEIADTFFFMIASRWTRNEMEKKAVYALTNIIVNTMTILAMSYLKLIAKQGMLILTGFTVINFLSKVIELPEVAK